MKSLPTTGEAVARRLENVGALRPQTLVQLNCRNGDLLDSVAERTRSPLALVAVAADATVATELSRAAEQSRKWIAVGNGEPSRWFEELTRTATTQTMVVMWERASGVAAPDEESLLLAAAAAGFFLVAPPAPPSGPSEAPDSLAWLHLRRRDFRIRTTRESDLPALEELERVCWPAGLQTSREQLLARLRRYPDGQLALVADGDRVVAAVYSQRTSLDVDLTGITMWTAETLHRSDGAQAYLLGIGVLPEVQHRNFGNELLEFMLQLSSRRRGVERVVGVTRCKDYARHSETTPENYIRRRNELGSLLDTTLRFHELHGAEIVSLVPGYRPADEENRGYGVLVRYDLATRRPAAPVQDTMAKRAPTDKASISRFVRGVADGLLKKDGDRGLALSLARPLMEMGLDSGDVLELRERINHHYGLAIETEFFFDHNTLGKVIDALVRRIAEAATKPVPPIAAAAPSARQNSASVRAEDIAIVGLAVRLPGGVEDPAGFWQLLANGRFVVDRAPRDRFAWPEGIDPDGEHRGIDRGGFLSDVAGFDAELFRISRKEAELMDPQQRLLLELTWECLEHAGYAPDTLGDTRTGVFVGASGSDYGKLLAEAGIETEAHTGLGASMAIVPNRISYFFDFSGPSLLIDTACSSSLVAVHTAVKALRGGECDQALVGGVNILCHAPGSVTYYKAGMLSPDGCCKSFDAAANGYVRAEGAGMVMLKPMARALADGDAIHAVIKGSAVNHGGRANGLTVPQPKKQAALVADALRDAGVAAERVGYIEAHGSATPLGDPIEISGLKQAFAELTGGQPSARPYCGIGSVKSNVGHLEAAAGVVGLIKTVLALKHRTIPASLHFNRLNPHISLDDSPFYIAAGSTAWQPHTPDGLRLAGVSSFGSGGANAHVVVEEAPAHSPSRTSLPRRVFSRQRYWALDRKPVQAASRLAPAPTVASTTLWRPIWRDVSIPTHRGPTEERRIVLCDLAVSSAEIRARVPDGATIAVLRSSAAQIEERFGEYAEYLLETLREPMRSAGGRRLLVQVLVPNDKDGSLLTGLTGALKTLHAENPRIDGQLLVVEPTAAVDRLLAHAGTGSRLTAETILRFQGNVLSAPRWQQLDRLSASVQPPWRADGVYLIFGGAGGLGRIFAHEIAGRMPTARVIVAGRSASTPALPEGAVYRSVDLSRDADVAALVRATVKDFGRLDGVLHCAGVLRDSLAIKKTAAELREVFSSKVQGTANLARALATLERKPDFLVLFGSTSGVLGNVGQFDYAAANAFQDAFANGRNDLAQRVLAIDWPLWRDGGMHVDAATETALRAQWGAQSLDTVAGLAAFYHAYQSGEAQVLVWNGAPAKIAELPEKRAVVEIAPPLLASAPRVDVTRRLKEVLAEVIGTPADEIDAAKTFDAYGVDSILMTDLNRKLGEVFPEMSRTLLYEHDTVAALAKFLEAQCPAECARWIGPVTATEATAPMTEARHAAKDSAEVVVAGGTEPIAIVGLSVRFPGADDLEGFWRLLKAGGVSIAEGPTGRWTPGSTKAPDEGKRAVKWGGFLREPYAFDPLFFGITPREAEQTDPQERLFLEECWKAMEDAGWSVADLPAAVRQKTAVFGAITKQGYNLTGSDERLPVTSFASLANRVSYHFDLQGPSLPIDTMCSSALVAVHHACQYLRHGGELAIVGGVNLYLHPSNFEKLAAEQLVSGTERSDPFGREGDGFVPGEGVGALVLKPLSKAERDGDAIYAVIRGTAVNHGGKSANYTSPSARQQAAVIHEALVDAAVGAETIGYLETAANGSQTGDAAEAAAISKAFGQRTAPAANRYLMGSVKANIGHPESASGIAQIAKVLLALRHRVLPPTVLGEKFESCVPLERLPFELIRRAEPWTPLTVDGAALPRRAGISGVGAGGVNAHIVLEEYVAPPSEPSRPTGEAVVIPLSAKTPEALRAYATAWIDYLDEHPDADLAQLAYVAQVGRSAMVCRRAIVATGHAELKQALRSEFTPPTSGATRQALGDAIQRALAERDWPALARAWEEGGDVPWLSLYAGRNMRRLPGLPVYPFARRHCGPMAPAPEEPAQVPTPIVASTAAPANRAIEFYAAWAQNSASEQREDFLTFCPFETRLPGFSMSRAFLFPEKYRNEWALMKAKQIELRQVLFYEEDFSRLEAVFDIGCGFGNDLLGMARTYPQLRADGFSLTADQVKVAGARIVQAGLQSRVRVFQQDSSATPYPGRYDFVMGIEVTFHIREKDRLFRNIVTALRPGGRVLLMDFVTNLRGAIVEPNLEISIPTKREWVELLSRHGLVLTSVIDVSPQIANFLHDPDYREITRDLPELVQQTFQNYANQSQSLERGWVSYCLLKIQKSEGLDHAELCRRNRACLEQPTPYPVALAAMKARGPAPYPRNENEPASVPAVASARTPESPKVVAIAPPIGAVKDELLGLCANELGFARAEVSASSSFRDLAAGSVEATRLTQAVNERFDLELPTSVILECRTVGDFAAAIAARVAETGASLPASATVATLPKVAPVPMAVATPFPPRSVGRDDIAIIGLSVRCAGANGPEEFWNLIREGRDALSTIDDPRWLDVLRPNLPPSAEFRRGTIDDVGGFDASFFNISPKEAGLMDVAQRVILEETYKALEDAGYTSARLQRVKVGTFLGTSGSNSDPSETSHFSLLGSDASVMASRLAYYLDLKGPAVAVNAACASALAAIDLAIQKLQRGEIDVAIAGGVAVFDDPLTMVRLHKAGLLSTTGRCRPFDAAANGFLLGDGVGVVVLKRLADAERDRDPIYGVIRGLASNHNGQTLGLTVPSASAQCELLNGLYARQGIVPTDIQYVETNGTATKLGDSIEFGALSKTYGANAVAKQSCVLGALKGNVGNCAAASGALALIKVLLCLKHRQLPPIAGFTTHNPELDLPNSPFRVERTATEWPRNARGPRLAALNSFGFNGTNYHVVIEEYPAARLSPRRAAPNSDLLLLSAHSRAQLNDLAVQLAGYIEREREIPLEDILFTLRSGRRFHAVRAAIVATDREGLVRDLAEFAQGGEADGDRIFLTQPNATSVCLDDTPEGADFLARLAASGRVNKLAELWVNGSAIDWDLVSFSPEVQRIAGLPAYPFARAAIGQNASALPTGSMAAMTPPFSPVEEVLAATLSNCLSLPVERIGVETPFQKLGLDSIVAGEWSGELNRRHGIVVGLQSIYEHASIRQLAAWLDRQGQGQSLVRIPGDGNATDAPEKARPAPASEPAVPYAVRPATLGDLEEWSRLEQALLSESLATPLETLRERMERNPEGNYFVERDGRTAGFISLQRVKSAEHLRGVTFDELGSVRSETTGDVLQLIALELLPEWRDVGLSGELLEWVLRRGKATAGVRSVVHIARCRGFAGRTESEFARYLLETHRSGFAAEPTLREHRERGGDVRGLVVNYRAADRANLGLGVWVQHDFEGAVAGARRTERIEADIPSHRAALPLSRLMKDRPEIVPLAMQGQGPTTFWIHPMSGEVGVYYKLAGQIGGEFKMIGLQARGFLRPEHTPIGSMAGLARHYADIVTAVQPSGPYHLAGFSFGGTIAHEVARELQSRGAQVASLLLIEAPFVTDEVGELARMSRRSALIMNANFLVLALLTTDSKVAAAMRSGATDWTQYRVSEDSVATVADNDLPNFLAAHCRRCGVTQAVETVKQKLVTMTDVHLANLRAVQTYRTTALARPEEIRCVLLRTREAIATSKLVLNPPYLEEIQRRHSSMTAVLAGWKSALPHAEAVVLDGANHFELFHDDASVKAVGQAVRIFYRSAGAVSPVRDGGARPVVKPKLAASAPIIAAEGASTTKSGIAVIGMSGRFPEAPDIDAFWRNLADGKSSVKEVPSDRGWSIEDYYDPKPQQPGKTYCRRGAFLEHVDRFDPLFFGISPLEAELMDPSERLFLQEAWRAIENAGYAPGQLKRQKWGVFACVKGDYATLVQKYHPTFLAATDSSPPARLSYTLDLSGPAMSIDTACSSALAAVAHACDSLALRHCDTAVVGAGGVYATPNMLVTSSQSLLFSPDGECYTFDERANGTVLGEAVGVVVLKRLEDALADGDSVYGVIRGWGTNQNGRTNGLTAPSALSQAALQADVYRRHGIDPGRITMVEAHGTGTKLGDPVEYQALCDSFARHTKKQRYCALGSLKTNIGHPFAAAGIAGLIKVLLSLRHRQIPPSLNFQKLNPYIADRGSPFYVNTALREWDAAANEPRLAAINSFGATGINVHLVVEEHAVESDHCREFQRNGLAAPVAIVLSAKDRQRLDDACRSMREWLREHGGDSSQPAIALADLAYTLQVARDPMESRVAFVAESLADLAVKLERVLDPSAAKDGLHFGEVKLARNRATGTSAEIAGTTAATVATSESSLDRLAHAWVNGATIDWAALYGDAQPRRIHLPGYVFAQDRYWVGSVAPVEIRPRDERTVSETLHPLVQRNTSTVGRQRYSASFSGGEFFLADHVVHGEKLLPGVAYLELAREAAMRALPDWNTSASSRLVCLKNVVWVRPFAVGSEQREIHIAIEARGTELAFEIYSDDPGAPAQRIVHSQGAVERRDRPATNEPADLAALQARCARTTLTADECYAAFAANRVDYGPGHRGVRRIHIGGSGAEAEVLAQLALPASVREGSGRFVLHPSLLDSALQAAIGLAFADDPQAARKRLSLPFALEELEIHGPCVPEMWVHIRRVRTADAGESVEKLYLALYDSAGAIRIRMRGFSSKVVGGSAPTAEAMPKLATALFAPVWRPVIAEATSAPSTWRRRIICVSATASNDLPRHGNESAIEVECLAPGDGSAAERYTRLATGLLARIRTLLSEKTEDRVLLQVVFLCGSQGRLFSAVSALLRSVEQEHPRFAGQTIELSGERWPGYLFVRLDRWSAAANRKELRDHVSSGTGLDWERLPEPIGESPQRWRDGGVYLITGGAGGLGRLFAREIATQAKQPVLILVGRSSSETVQDEALEDLRRLGATVVYESADVTQRGEVDRLIAGIVARHGALHGVLHAAGLLRDKLVVHQTDADFAAVLGPKVAGTENLDEATKDLPLDLFVLFSSGAGVLGNVGQAGYAAANAFMDRFATWRSEAVGRGERHGRTLAIDWPLWEEGGMRADAAAIAVMTRKLGVVPLRTTSGMRAFYAACAGSATQVMVVEGDRSRLATPGNGAVVSNPENAPEPVTVPAAAGGVVDADTGWREKTVTYFQTLVATMLKLPVHRIDPTATFEQYGIDSIVATALVNQLEEKYGSLPKTLFFEYQNVEALADYFSSRHRERTAELIGTPKHAPAASVVAKPAEVPAPTVVRSTAIEPTAGPAPAPTIMPAGATTDIAIVALAGRFPGARTVAELWENLKAGKDGVTEIPAERWDLDAHFAPDKSQPGKSYSKWGGFIEGVDRFDPLFFNLAPQTAALIDPKERLFLETVWELFESAGLTRETVERRHAGAVGVFVGAMYQDYHGFDSTWINESIVGLSSYSSIANRVSHFFNLRGPSVAIDTMCSSTLTAIKMACDSLARGECEMAIAGGANLSLHPKKYAGLSLGRMIGSHPDSRSFADGDGYIPAETVGAFLLKPLASARRDGDRIAAVIKSVQLNHDGRSNGYAIPNPVAQAKLIQENFRRSGIHPRTIGYVEAAANGSALGDPIELAALRTAFRAFTDERQYCAIGAVKSNFGHAEAASGVGQLAKVVLQLQHGELVPSIKAERLNPSLSFDDSPFYLQREHAAWPRQKVVENGREVVVPRRASISSFGAGGSNAHMIVEEYLPEATATENGGTSPESHVIVLSARTAGRLRAHVERILAFLDRTPDAALRDLAYTLQCGREAMDCRLAFVADGIEPVRDALRTWLDATAETGATVSRLPATLHIGDANTESPWHGLASGRAGAAWVQGLIADRDFEKLALIWSHGAAVPWRTLYEQSRPNILPLPTYPFERRRCWIETSASVAPAALSIAGANSVIGGDPKADTAGADADGLSLLAQLLGLERNELNPDKPLEEYGVDSILLAQLAQQLQTRGAQLSLAELRSQRSIRELTTALSGDAVAAQGTTIPALRGAEFRELVPLGKGAEPPVFWFHAGVGGVEAYQAIAAHSRRAFYGIQARGWMSDDEPLRGIPALAERYTHIVRTVQPSGPYDLGGYSMGGALAYEVTRRLQEAGQVVRSIVMLDTLDSTGVGNVRPTVNALYLQVVNTLLASAGAGASDGMARRLIHRDELPPSLTEPEFLDRLISLGTQRGLTKAEAPLRALIVQMTAVQRAYDYERFAIAPLPRPEEVTCHYVRNANGVFLGPLEPYFTLADLALDRADHWEEWQRHLPNFQRIDVSSSNHMTLLMEPQSLAKILELCTELYRDSITMPGVEAL